MRSVKTMTRVEAEWVYRAGHGGEDECMGIFMIGMGKKRRKLAGNASDDA
jgi:hypothetical protein